MSTENNPSNVTSPFSRSTVLLILGVALTATPMALIADQPNVLFIISDDLTATAMGSYGNSVVQTPNLDALSAAGVQFNGAYSQYPVCGPSRASMLTGLYPKALGATGNGSSNFRSRHPDIVSMPQLFRENGYTTARVSKVYHMGVPGDILAGTAGVDDPLSWDTTVNIQGPEQFAPGDFVDLAPFTTHQGSDFLSVQADGGDLVHADGMASQQAINWLQQHQSTSSDPFFLAVGMVRPHVPLVAPRSYYDAYPPEQMQLPFVPPGDLDDIPTPAKTQTNAVKYGMSEEQQKQVLSAYFASVSYMDAQVGKILDELDRLNMRDDTIVVFTSDHGYNLGEHTTWQKLSLFEDTVRVPLIVSLPDGLSAGEEVGDVVEMVDVYPTLAELAGLTPPIAPFGLHGRSLVDLIEDPTGSQWNDEAAYTITSNLSESLRTDEWRYNLWSNGAQELYDQVNDPHEYTNLAGHPAYASILQSLDAQMDEFRADSQSIPQRLLGDLNEDTFVDVADWMIFRENLYTDLSGYTSEQAFLLGDLNLDGTSTGLDFRIFKSTFDAMNGSGAFEEMLNSIPEPGGQLLLLVGVAMFWCQRRLSCATSVSQN